MTLLERHDEVGGRAGTLEVDGFRFDTGPSWYFMPEVFEHFFGLLGARVEDHLDLVPLDPAYRVFFEPGADGAASTFELSGNPGVNRSRLDAIEPGAGGRVAAYAEDASEAYGLALDHFLYTTFERPDRALSPAVVRRLPRLAALLRESLADRAARAVEDPRLQQLLGYHAVFLGSSPYRAPALYSLMSHLDLVDGVQYPRGGMYTLIEAVERLARDAGAEVRTGADVAGIEVVPGGGRRGRVTGVRLASGELVEADVVVSAADRHHTETALLEPRWADLPAAAWEDKGPGISALLVLAGVRGELPELAHHSLFFTKDWPANFDAVLGPDRRSDPAACACPSRPRSTCRARARPTGRRRPRPRRRPATRTCSSSSRSPPTPRSAGTSRRGARSTGSPTATSPRWGAGRASRTSRGASSRGACSGPRTSRPSSRPGVAARSAWSTPCGSPPCGARGTRPAVSTGSTTPEVARSRAWDCRCA